MKRIILLLALLFAVPQVSAFGLQQYDLGCLFCPGCCIQQMGSQAAYLKDFSSNHNIAYAVYLPAGNSTALDLRSTMDLYSTDLKLYVISSDSLGNLQEPNTGDTITLNCLNQQGTYYLDAQPNWRTLGIADFTIRIQSQISTAFFLTNEEAFTKYSELCSATINGDDVFLAIHYRPKAENPLDKAFKIPNDATNDLISRAGHTLLAVFDITKLVIIIVGFLLLLFIMTYLIKAFIFFIKKLMGR